ncbi:uncharacterized protein LOC134251633 [Saccostrea cucullata]|uniref:uncharacterized protein LOC134251633 n=1 Tax=Saccostrea cuccullata TaxID=36930 RepID=UPI002ED5003F
MKQLQSDDVKSVDGQSVLDFGEEPVKNLDAKLEILEFNYSWVDEVEKEERMAEEANERALEAADFTKQKQWVSDGENRTIYGQEFLDFGEEPVKSLDAKLDVLKFTYSWATEVEENERRKEEETRLQTKGQEYGVEREIQKAVPKEDAQVKAPEKPQEVTSENQRNGITEKLKDPLQEKEMDKDLSKPAELCKDEKPEPDVYQHGQNLSNIQQLTDDEEDHFIPRRLFLFGITEFKNDARQITTCNEMSVPIVGCPVNEYSTTSTTCTSEATMASL